MPRDIDVYLRDILEAIERIKRFTDGLTFDVFADDSRTVDAVLLNVLKIGEAAKPGPAPPGCGGWDCIADSIAVSLRAPARGREAVRCPVISYVKEEGVSLHPTVAVGGSFAPTLTGTDRWPRTCN